ncbi:MAG: ABC transporter substrate-binding protein [Oligoflexales bacterium]|nr:ABC transporter substrate-binding protein [Oligoflexales bacterium]
MKKKYLYFLTNFFLVSSYSFSSSSDLKNSSNVLPKVVSLSIASDELLFELYSRSKQLSRILAFSKLVDDPRYSNIAQQSAIFSNKERYGGSLEHLLKLAPELVVLADFNQPELVHNLKKSKTPIFELKSSNTLVGLLELIKSLGNRLGASEHSTALTLELETKLTKIKKNANGMKNKPQVLFLLADGTSAGEDTLIHDLIVQAGGINFASSFQLKGWPHISTEQLLKSQADLILTIGKDQNIETRFFQKHPIYKNLIAVQKNQIILINEAKLFAMSHFTFAACEELQKNLLIWSNNMETTKATRHRNQSTRAKK